MKQLLKNSLKNTELPLVSVVILTYKKFQYVREAIDSICKQDYPFLQIIISDDGSINFPKNDIERYIEESKRSNVISYKIIHHHKNIGTVKNLNNAYDNADGKFIFPLSNDDVFISEDVISKITNEFLLTNANVMITSRLKCDENGRPICYLPLRSELKYVNKMNTREKQFKSFISEQYYDMASGSALYIKKEFWKRIGKFDERYILWEDGPFIAKILSLEKIKTRFDIVSIKYRIGGVSNVSKNQLLLNDKLLFDSTDKISYAKQFKWITRKKIQFDIARNKVNSKKELLLVYIKNPIGLLMRILYKTKRRYAYKKEKLKKIIW